MKKICLLFTAVFIIFSLSACGKEVPNDTDVDINAVNSNAYPKTVTDTRGVEVVLEREPTRIISLNPNITEIMYAIGASDKLIGRTDYCTYPLYASSIQSIGDMMNPNFELIVSLEADVVICSNMMMDEFIKKFEDSGVKVIQLGGEDKISNTYDSIRFIADIVNKTAEAEIIIQDLQTELSEVAEKVKELDKPTVYYVVGFGEYGDYTAGGNTFIGEMIKISGAANIAESVTDWKYSLEKIIENDPYIIICPNKYGNKDLFEGANGYKDLTAVKEGRIYDIDEDLLTIAGPRIGKGAKALAKLFHPELEFN